MTIKDDPHDALVDDDEDGGLYEAVTEINVLESPSSERCQWDKGCCEPSTHNVCQYNPYSLMDLVDGVDLLSVRAARARHGLASRRVGNLTGRRRQANVENGERKHDRGRMANLQALGRP